MLDVHTLICHRDVTMALRCLASFVQCVAGARLVLHDDGTLTNEDIERLAEGLPISGIVRRGRADDAMREALRRYPACARARSENVLMLKLFDVALLGDEPDIRYCDTDILFFRRVSGLFDRSADQPAAVFMRDPGHAYAARPWHLIGPEGMRLAGHLNSGLFLFPRDRFDLEFLEWLLAKEKIRAIFAHIRSWAEQTCWAALAHRAGCGMWDEECISVVNEGWTAGDRTVAAHFVSSSRHRLAEALPQAPGASQSNGEPKLVAITESRRCSALDLGASQIIRRIRRACGY